MSLGVTLLDGGMGRELARIGAPFRLPEWSALALIEAPDLVREAHAGFVAAGADVITANSYALTPHHLGEAASPPMPGSWPTVPGGSRASRREARRGSRDRCRRCLAPTCPTGSTQHGHRPSWPRSWRDWRPTSTSGWSRPPAR